MTDPFDGMPANDLGAETGFAGGTLDRLTEKRGPDDVAKALAHPAAGVYVLRGDRVVLHNGGALHGWAEAERAGAERENLVLLGWQDGSPRLASGGPPDDNPADHLIDLRTLAMQSGAGGGDNGVDQGTLGNLALARGLTMWHARHRFCANCGAPTTMTQGGFRRDCGACGVLHFPRTDPVVIMAVIDVTGDAMVLGRSPRFAPSVYSCLAGFMEPGETIENAVRRETFEESGIKLGRVRYLASQPWPFPYSLMIGCMGEALTTEITMDDDELEDCRWFTRDEVVAMMAGTHALKAPMTMAIAHRLIRAWVEG